MTPKEYLTKKNFCTLPWTGVFIRPDGDVRNCAVTKTSMGNINDTPLEEILHGPINESIKNDMLGDVFAPRCNQCYSLEKNQKNTFDAVSNRVWYLKTLAKTHLDLFDQAANYELKVLDLRWKNTCNFACVYCSHEFSSMWANELGLPQRINDAALEKSLEYIYANLDTVGHLYLAGGEPMLIKENLALLNHLQEHKPDIEIRINSNLSIINNPIYNKLKEFKNVHWTISVDSIGEEFEYTRYGGSWAKFTENLKQLRQDFEKINFNAVWFVLNGKGIFPCFDYLLDMGFHENTFIVNPLDDPLPWHVNNLPDTVLEEIRDEIKARLSRANPQYSLYNSLDLMLKYTYTPITKNLQATFKELNTIDTRRKLDSSKIFTELYTFKEGN